MVTCIPLNPSGWANAAVKGRHVFAKNSNTSRAAMRETASGELAEASIVQGEFDMTAL